jgi:hypothetical protein
MGFFQAVDLSPEMNTDLYEDGWRRKESDGRADLAGEALEADLRAAEMARQSHAGPGVW